MSRRAMAFAASIAVASLALPRPVEGQKNPVTQPLVTAAVAGQGVGIIPFSMLVVEPTVPTGTFTLDRAHLLLWSDSLLQDGALSRAPEVNWVSQTELRRISRRSGGLVPDPDRLGQSILRGWKITSVPDPLRSNLRKLLAMAGGLRYALIPASLIFKTDSTGALAADLSILLADVRTGRVVWRSLAKGSGGTPDQVLAKAIATVFPVEGEQP